MSQGDGRTTISNGLPRLGEISRAVTRGIRGLAEIAGGPSFAESLASATTDGDQSAAGTDPTEGDLMRGGQKTGDLPRPGANLMARPGRDRAIGAGASASGFLPAQQPIVSHLPSVGPPSTTPTPPPATPASPYAPQPSAPSVPNATLASFPQSGPPATVANAIAAQGTAYAAIPSPATGAAPDQSAAAASSVVSPSLSAASRSLSLSASTPASGNGATAPGLALKEYPRPSRSDRSGVLSWSSASPLTGKELDRLVSEARERRVGWVTFVADPERADEYGELADRLTKAGIQPIARVQDPEGNLPAGDVGELVKELRDHGVRYFQLFDDANVAEQTPDYRVDVPDYAQRWLAAAKAVVAGGGLPGFGALSADGDYDDLGFMRQVLSAVKERGGTDVLGRSWIALRGETPGAAVTKDDVDDLASRAEWFDRVSRQALGRSLPILATLDPTGRSESLMAEASATDQSAPAEQAEEALRGVRRNVPALFAASRGTVGAARA